MGQNDRMKRRKTKVNENKLKTNLYGAWPNAVNSATAMFENN
jgi:hypothetical protein